MQWLENDSCPWKPFQFCCCLNYKSHFSFVKTRLMMLFLLQSCYNLSNCFLFSKVLWPLKTTSAFWSLRTKSSSIDSNLRRLWFNRMKILRENRFQTHSLFKISIDRSLNNKSNNIRTIHHTFCVAVILVWKWLTDHKTTRNYFDKSSKKG